MTLELIDITFGRIGYPKNVEYTESDLPDRWESQWKRKNALDSKFYKQETSKNFTYSLNIQGYRDQEWKDIDWNNSIICLGCSHTFGVGVSQDKTIPAQLAKKLNISCVNLGIPGGCNFFSLINSAKLINNNIKPKAVIFQRTYQNRWFDIENNVLHAITSRDKKITNFFPNNEYSNFLDNSINDIIFSQWNNICPIVEFDMEMFDDHIDHKYIARDGSHWNGLYFEKITDFIINTLEGDTNELN